MSGEFPKIGPWIPVLIAIIVKRKNDILNFVTKATFQAIDVVLDIVVHLTVVVRFYLKHKLIKWSDGKCLKNMCSRIFIWNFEKKFYNINFKTMRVIWLLYFGVICSEYTENNPNKTKEDLDLGSTDMSRKIKNIS